MAVAGHPYLAMVSITIATQTWFCPNPPNSLGIIRPSKPNSDSAFNDFLGYI